MNFSRGIESIQALAQGLHRSLINQIMLGDDNTVSHRRLLHRLGLRIHGAHTQYRIDRSHHRVQGIAAHHRHAHQGVQDRRRIGQTGGFNHHPAKWRDFSAITFHRQVTQGIHQIAAHGTAQTAGGQQDGVLVGRFNQAVIQANFTELIDDHRRIRQIGMLQQAIEQGGFAATQKAGDHRYRQTFFSRAIGIRSAMGFGLHCRLWCFSCFFCFLCHRWRVACLVSWSRRG